MMGIQATEAQLKPMAPLILSALTKLLDDTEEAEADVALTQLRAFTYQAIGQLAQRAPQLFR